MQKVQQMAHIEITDKMHDEACARYNEVKHESFGLCDRAAMYEAIWVAMLDLGDE